MAGTIFSKDEIIEGTDNGEPYKFQALKDGVEGSGSIYGPGIDLLHNNEKVFLKKYVDPAPRSLWFNAFVDYQKKIQNKIEQSSNAKQLIAGIHRYFQDNRRRFWQTIEYVENSKDMKKYLESDDTTWEQRMMFAKVFMFAMKVLHEELRLVHGDLKPANLLLIPLNGGTYSVKLIDFDRPILLDESEVPWSSEGYIGSEGYFSPEHKKRQRPTDKSDVFTCGLILYELLAKEGHPFNYATVSADYNENAAPMPHLLGTFGNEESDRLIEETLHRMLEPNPDDRPTANEVYQVFFRAGGSIRPQTPKAAQDHTRVAQPAYSAPVASVSVVTNQSPVDVQALKGAADVVFLLDSTGSMTPCITALKQHIHSFIEALVHGDDERNISPVEDWRARIVGFRNFEDCNKSEKNAKLYRKFGGGGWLISNPFTRDENELHSQLDKLKSFGGGKAPQESLLDALMLVLKSGFLPTGQQDAGEADGGRAWRTNGVGRIVIVFTDAGYHPTMSYCAEKTLFEEGALYPLDLRGAGLDELQHAIESGFFKVYVFAPNISDYDELSDLSNVLIMQSDDEDEGLVKMMSDSQIERLIDDIVKGVSRSSSDFREIPI
ncbi:protein kinase [Fibrobacter sp. UWB13]|uniref:protein kinase domain-containing protein n=1 Tax=Fibrobacter sp. UWB13 TaxID=1896204 RepID=UPI000A0A2FCC|nr:protein kinase [Fibrobacter sp. UWB13]SMG35489.1 Serine/threonine protein kinase [Fibrobacter sp. UWB13]